MIVLAGSPTVKNCTFVANIATFAGGGLYATGASCSLTNCQFLQNSGGQSGGAIHITQCVAQIREVRCRQNSAGRGGAMCLEANTFATLANCVLDSNSATASFSGGGGLWIDGTISIRNCTIYGNTSPLASGGAIRNTGGVSNCHNSIFWANTGIGGTTSHISEQGAQTSMVVTYSTVQGGGEIGTGNSTANPQFLDAAAGDLRLNPFSPAIDSGSNTLVLPDMVTDIEGSPRKVDMLTVADTGVGPAPIVDRGAYERHPPANCPADLNGDGLIDGFDLGTLLANFGTAGLGDLDGNGLIDGADLGTLLGEWGPCE